MERDGCFGRRRQSFPSFVRFVQVIKGVVGALKIAGTAPKGLERIHQLQYPPSQLYHFTGFVLDASQSSSFETNVCTSGLGLQTN